MLFKMSDDYWLAVGYSHKKKGGVPLRRPFALTYTPTEKPLNIKITVLPTCVTRSTAAFFHCVMLHQPKRLE
jgi:hypothetical protein